MERRVSNGTTSWFAGRTATTYGLSVWLPPPSGHCSPRHPWLDEERVPCPRSNAPTAEARGDRETELRRYRLAVLEARFVPDATAPARQVFQPCCRIRFVRRGAVARHHCVCSFGSLVQKSKVLDVFTVSSCGRFRGDASTGRSAKGYPRLRRASGVADVFDRVGVGALAGSAPSPRRPAWRSRPTTPARGSAVAALGKTSPWPSRVCLEPKPARECCRMKSVAGDGRPGSDERDADELLG